MYAVLEKLEKPFQLFILLKFFYPNGRARLSNIEKQALLNQLPCKDLRTLNSNIKRLEQIGWIRRNSATGYYQIASIYRLRQLNNWNSRAGVEVNFESLVSIHAIIGHAIYSYLHMAFWRNVKTKGGISLKGSTYHSGLLPSFKIHNQFAPIATTGIKALYGISPKKASYLKHEAHKHGFLSIKKEYENLPHSYSTIQKMIRIELIPPHARKINGKYYLQLIDKILPLKGLIRLSKLQKT